MQDLLFGEFDASVFRAPVFGCVIGEWLSLPEPFGREPHGGNAVSKYLMKW